jgi:aspartyl-tRNA(Asn)/glutamyl-tRNA(Gln) amidotransferase subunit B
VLDDGGRIKQETRHFHEDTGVTTSGRSKEEAEDYRYFPEPDLTPVAPSEAWIEELRGTLPEPPAARRARLQSEWGFTDLEWRDIINASALDVIEETVTAGASPAAAKKWWLGEVARRANETGNDLDALGVTPAHIVRIDELVNSGALNDKLARQTLEGVLNGEGDPDTVVAARGFQVVSDEGALLAAIDEAVAANPEVADKIREGKVQAAGALIGSVMKATKGQADAAQVRELLLKRLGVEG